MISDTTTGLCCLICCVCVFVQSNRVSDLQKELEAETTKVKYLSTNMETVKNGVYKCALSDDAKQCLIDLGRFWDNEKQLKDVTHGHEKQ